MAVRGHYDKIGLYFRTCLEDGISGVSFYDELRLARHAFRGRHPCTVVEHQSRVLASRLQLLLRRVLIV